MYKIVTRNAEELAWDEFDGGFYEVKDVTGRQSDPIDHGVNMISCHGDTVASEDLELVPIDENGRPATRERPYFDWGYVCPTHPDYRSGLMQIIDACADHRPDIRLDDVGFPRNEYCHCERCNEQFQASSYADRDAWRASVIAEFLAEARDHVPGTLYLTVYPNPYPGHLRRRTGLDPDLIDDIVDEFVVPIYDMAYTTTYWIEILAQGFRDTLDTRFSIELYAVQVETERLLHAAEVANAYASDVVFGYDAGNARGVIRRMRAETADGRTYGEPAEPQTGQDS